VWKKAVKMESICAMEWLWEKQVPWNREKLLEIARRKLAGRVIRWIGNHIWLS